MSTRITIRKPDDWHLHVRDDAMLKAVLPFTAKHFGRAILMPNLVPPVVTTNDAVAYRGRVMAALPKGSTFKPLMTCYLTDDTDRRRTRLQGGCIHRGEALPRPRHHLFGRGRYGPSQDHAGVGADGKDRHAVPDARRGRRTRGGYLRPRSHVHRALSLQVDEAVPCPALYARAPVVEGRRRFRSQRGASGRRHDHALSSRVDPHRLARVGTQAVHILHARHQNGEGPGGAAQGSDLR